MKTRDLQKSLRDLSDCTARCVEQCISSRCGDGAALHGEASLRAAKVIAEMSHRVKNPLAIASGLTSITSRSTKTTGDMARELIQRLTPLGRAHDLVRPPGGQQGKAALLGDLIAVLLAPYDDMGAFSGRVPDSVPRMGVGEATANTLALVLHELATNSLKRCPVVLHRHARRVVYGVGR